MLGGLFQLQLLTGFEPFEVCTHHLISNLHTNILLQQHIALRRLPSHGDTNDADLSCVSCWKACHACYLSNATQIQLTIQSIH